MVVYECRTWVDADGTVVAEVDADSAARIGSRSADEVEVSAEEVEP